MSSINVILANIILKLANPWLLLVLVPGVILAFFPYFRMRKDKRRTRNRIVSMILHLVILSLAALVLAGFTIENKNQLKQDETIILVDVSDSNYGNADEMTDYINRVIGQSDVNNKVAVVAFGAGTPRVVIPLRAGIKRVDNVFSSEDETEQESGFIRYEGTDISSALTYAANMFTNKNSLAGCRIIIMSDGLETDGKASELAGSLSARGLTIDAVYFEPVKYEGKQEVLISSLAVSNQAPEPNQPFDLTFTVKSHFPVRFDVRVFDYAGVQNKEVEIDGKRISDSIEGDEVNGDKQITINGISLAAGGVHPLRVELDNIDFIGPKEEGDTHEDWTQNNKYYNYVVVQTKQSGILVIDGSGGSSTVDGFIDLLENPADTSKTQYKITKTTSSTAPTDLSGYGEVILVNVDARTLPRGFDTALERYVNNGGGLLTMGGEKTFYNGGMNNGNSYAQVLPINTKPQATDTKAVIIAMDYSSGMVGGEGSPISGKLVDRLKEGLMKALRANVFSTDDYLSIFLFGGKTSPDMILPFTSGGDLMTIFDAVNQIGTKPKMSNTEWRHALEYAVRQLNAFNGVDNKHIIFITDGGNASQEETSALTSQGYPNGGWKYYGASLPSGFSTPSDNVTGTGPNGECYTGYAFTQGITTSTVLLYNRPPNGERDVEKMAIDGHGHYYFCDTADEVSNVLDEECRNIPKKLINTSENEDFDGKVNLSLTVETQSGAKTENLPELKGFNGCTVKEGATTYVDTASNDAIFVRWQYGQGKSSALMTDISTEWAQDFASNEDGKKLLRWMVDQTFCIMPSGLSSDAKYTFEQENFTTKITVEPSNEDIDYIEAFYHDPKEGLNAAELKERPIDEQINALCPADGSGDVMSNTLRTFSSSFYTMKEGLYTVTFFRGESDGNGGVYPLDSVSVPYAYVTFSYSKEYDTFSDSDVARRTLNDICAKSGGRMLVKTNGTIESIFSSEFQYDTVEINPQSWLMIIALVLFILDVLVRKFKFLWPHEIIRKISGKETKAEA